MQNATNNDPTPTNNCSSGDVSCNKTLQIIIIFVCILGVGLIIFFTIKFRKYKYRQRSHVIVRVNAIRLRKDRRQRQEIVEETPNSDHEGSKYGTIEINLTPNAANKLSIVTFNNIYSPKSSVNENMILKIREPKDSEDEKNQNEDTDINMKFEEHKINQNILDNSKVLQEKEFSIFEEKKIIQVENMKIIS